MRAQHHSRSARDIRSNYLEVERRDSIPTDGIGPGNHPSGRMKSNPYFAKTCVHTLSPQKISELQSLLRSTEAKLSVGKKNVLQGLLITVNNLVLPPPMHPEPHYGNGPFDLRTRVLVSAFMGSCAVVFILLATNTLKDCERN